MEKRKELSIITALLAMKTVISNTLSPSVGQSETSTSASPDLRDVASDEGVLLKMEKKLKNVVFCTAVKRPKTI